MTAPKTAPASEQLTYRGPAAVFAEPGKEEWTYLLEAGLVLGLTGDEIDRDADLVDEYQCDETDMMELIQSAEDVWKRPLMPNPFRQSDIDAAIARYRTVNAIIRAARGEK